MLVYKIPYRLVYKIPYRRAPRLAYRLHSSAFRPSASREQRYLAYNLSSCARLAFRPSARASKGILFVYKGCAKYPKGGCVFRNFRKVPMVLFVTKKERAGTPSNI